MQGSANAFTPDANKLAALTNKGSPNLVAPTYAATITIDPDAGMFQLITTTSAIGNATLNALSVGKPGAMLELEIANDASSARTITFGTNFRSTGTVVGTASKSILVSFRSNGTKWMEVARSASAIT